MATRVYKLMTQENETKGPTKWGKDVTHEVSGEGELCSPGWLHAYTDPLLAVLINPIHANITNPKLWIAYGSGRRKDDHGLKVGFTRLTTKKEIVLPQVTTTQRVAFGILCALEVYKTPEFAQWAEGWLSGKDRSENAAASAAAAYAADAKINLKKIARKAMKV